MSENIITFKNVKVLNFIEYPDFYIPEKKITFVRGNSGSGKSTLLCVCNGTLEIDSGLVTYGGKNILQYDILKVRREILLVDQSPYFFEGSIYDNFSEYYSYRDLPCPSKDEINFYLSLCKISLPLKSICDDLSGGEKQRVFTAIFLSFNPVVLMLDEPTAALDEQTSIEIMDSLTSYCKSKHITLIVVSHDQGILENYSDHIIELGGE